MNGITGCRVAVQGGFPTHRHNKKDPHAMLKHNDNLHDQWDNVDRIVSRWLKERQEVILLFCAVDGLREFTPRSTPIAVKVKAFCQVLIDYVSAGHFEIYDELMREAADFNEDCRPLMKDILPRIQESTEVALDFNDRYADAEVETIHPAMARDLSVLGECLAERFELEDRLIESMHACHRELVA
jgi:regulator of sigma D